MNAYLTFFLAYSSWNTHTLYISVRNCVYGFTCWLIAFWYQWLHLKQSLQKAWDDFDGDLVPEVNGVVHCVQSNGFQWWQSNTQQLSSPLIHHQFGLYFATDIKFKQSPPQSIMTPFPTLTPVAHVILHLGTAAVRFLRRLYKCHFSGVIWWTAHVLMWRMHSGPTDTGHSMIGLIFNHVFYYFHQRKHSADILVSKRRNKTGPSHGH